MDCVPELQLTFKQQPVCICRLCTAHARLYQFLLHYKHVSQSLDGASAAEGIPFAEAVSSEQWGALVRAIASCDTRGSAAFALRISW